jgi:hypothetical protein
MLPTIKKYVPTFSNVSTDIIGKLFKLPANTPFWSISLQATVSCLDDLLVKITHTCVHDDSVFATIQITFCNIIDLKSSHVDKTNGEIHIDFHKLIPQ